MIGKTISHYKIIEKLRKAARVRRESNRNLYNQIVKDQKVVA
jgi:hypothetical protein